MISLIPFGLSLLSGTLLFLSFPRFEFFPLAWIALIPLLFAIQHQSTSRSFLLGWLTGLIYFFGTVSWVTISMHHYGKLSWDISYLLMVVLVSYLASFVGLFAALLRWTMRRLGSPSVAPFLWVTIELARGHLLTGFPWVSLGYSQYRFLPFIQIADITSIYGISFALVLANVALYRLIQSGFKKQIAWRYPLGTSLILLLIFSYGFIRLSQPIRDDKTLDVAVIQGNISQDRKWDKAFQDETVQIYKRLSLDIFNEFRPALVVWPESATPFFFQTETQYQDEVIRLAKESPFYLLFGSPAFETNEAGQGYLFNSAYLISPTTEAIPRYDKIHLVPFGEYVPLKFLLFFVSKIVEGVGDFIPGQEATVMEAAGLKVGTVICYEVIFPELVRRFVKRGAVVMTTITNDAWFGNSAAPDQHFSMVVFRAIENRIPFARAANTGISGFINSHGKIIKKTPLFVETALAERLNVRSEETFYTAYGDLFAIACAIITFALMMSAKRRTDAHRPAASP